MDYASVALINDAVSKGDFTTFDKLCDSQQIELMKNWDDDMQLKYLMREPTMTEDEFFSVLDRIANGTYEADE